MAALTVTEVRLVDGTPLSTHTTRASEAISQGAIIRIDGATGKWVLANGDNAAGAGNNRYIASKTVAAEETLTGYRDCLVDLGKTALNGLNFDVPLYLSDTVAAVKGLWTATALESTATVIVGYIVPVWSGQTVNRLVRVL